MTSSTRTPAGPPPEGAEAATRPALMHRVRLGHGFSYRREPFGGILYHYEGVAPDPRITFVDSPFLIDLLDQVAAHPEATVRAVVDQVAAHFGLQPAEVAQVETFLATLIERGALVPE